MIRHSLLSQSLLASSVCALALMAACASSAVVPDEGDDVQNDSTFAPKPYGSRQLRQALPVGSRITIRNEAKGKVHFEEYEVIEADREYLTMTHQITRETGEVVDDLGESDYSWNELRDQAAFPVDRTVRSEGSIEVPVGSFDTWLYVVTEQDDQGRPEVTYYHFAKELPGPPVVMSVVIDGKTTLNRTMVGRK
jgi:hypothetical protein